MQDSPVRPGQQDRRRLGPLSRLLPLLQRHRGLVAGAAVALLVASATTLSLPLAVRRVVDHGFDAPDTAFVDTYFAMLVVLSIVLAIASGARYYFVITLGERIVADLRTRIFDHVARLSPAFYDRTLSGEIVSRLTADTAQIKSAVGSTLSLALRNGILLVGAVAMMVATAPGLSFIVVAAIPFVVVPLVGFGRSVRRRARRAQDRLAEANAYAGETIASLRTVQAFTGEDEASRRYASAVSDAFQAARRSTIARAFLTAFAIFAIFTSIVLVLWAGAEQVIRGDMTAGTLGQFLLYAVFAAGALGQLSEVYGELAQAAGATERLTELLEERSAVEAPESPRALPFPPLGSVRFENVSFSYAGNPSHAVLSGLDFEVRPGETVAIVGLSGAGKSTLFSLIERFYDASAGAVLVDGVDVRRLDPSELRRRLAYVSQDVAIFAASVSDNIAFGAKDASREAIESAARTALVDDFVRRLPDGYETSIGERGVTLSGGQRQRLAIARAILRDAPILLLDEATSALDAQSERLVQTALDRLTEGRTTIVVAHRLATILKADRILVLENGRIVEEGTHASLIAKGGAYARLARLQFDTDLSAAAE